MGYQDLKLLKRPKGTTHARIVTDQGKKAQCEIKDFEVFEGVEGEVTFLKEERKGSIKKYKDFLNITIGLENNYHPLFHFHSSFEQYLI